MAPRRREENGVEGDNDMSDDAADDPADDPDNQTLEGPRLDAEDKDSSSSHDEGQSYPRAMLDTTDSELIKQFASRMVGWFGLVICDEVHFLKNIDSLIYRAVELLAAREKLFLTGTPMINRPVDLVGILQSLWDDTWWGDTDPSLEDYRRAALSSGTSISPAEVGRYLQYLNPTLYQRFASARSGEQISVLAAQAVLPVIFNTI